MTLTARLVVLLAALAALGGTTDPVKSIKPLQYQDMATGELVTCCTAWPTLINGFRFWIAALHCVTDDEGILLEDSAWFIDGTRARLHSGNAQVDLVALEGGPAAKPLAVALGPPAVRTLVWTAGYLSHGRDQSHAQHVSQGIVSTPRDYDGKAAYDLAIKPGMSGAPVMLDDGLVVGVLLQHECPELRHGWCPTSRGARVDQVRLFLFGE